MRKIVETVGYTLKYFQCVTVLVWVLVSKQSLRWGTGFRRFVWEMILGSSSKGIWRMRRGGRNTNEGLTTELVTTVGNWSLIPLGTLRKWAESLRISRWKAGRLDIYHSLVAVVSESLIHPHFQTALGHHETLACMKLSHSSLRSGFCDVELLKHLPQVTSFREVTLGLSSKWKRYSFMFYQLHECCFYSSEQLKKPDETDIIHIPEMRVCDSSSNGSRLYLHFLFFTYITWFEP